MKINFAKSRSLSLAMIVFVLIIIVTVTYVKVSQYAHKSEQLESHRSLLTQFPLSNINSTNSNSKVKDITEWSKFIDMDPIHIEMSGMRLFIAYMSNKKYYLEWGSGGSTQIAPLLIQNKAFSIEHDPQWCQNMKNNDIVQVLISLNKLSVECVDTKQRLKRWGYPVANANITQMGEAYVDYVDEIVHNRLINDSNFDGIFDAVFVDGRFRVACALKLFVNQYIEHGKSVLIVHDYFDPEHAVHHNYTKMEKYFEMIDDDKQLGTMAVFTPKIATSQLLDSAKIDLMLYMNIYG